MSLQTWQPLFNFNYLAVQYFISPGFTINRLKHNGLIIWSVLPVDLQLLFKIAS